jgi:eukaryotic-like serine/threonine-protein kinase
LRSVRFVREGRPAIQTPRLIGDRYRLGDVLGRSLMSEVRRGEDVVLQRPVAVKLLLDSGDPRSIARFEQEAQILARLHHPNVISVFDAGVDNGERFIVMELVEGPTLRELLDTEGRLAPERASEIASRLASALEFAHGKGVIHRDVKPANVLLPPDGGVKLADMGIARLLSPEALTATLSVRGTARYISPEQVRGDRVDARADLYSLGCVLFEMLTGRTPFEGDLAALSYAHTHTAAPRVRSIDPALPLAMDELVAAMLEKDPAKRPQTGEEVERSLASAPRHHAVEPTALIEPVHLPPTQRLPAGGRRSAGPKTRPMVLIAVGGLAALLFIALLASREPDGRTDASRRPQQISTSPTTPQPSPVETSSPATQQPSPVTTVSPPPDQSSPQEAAAIVLGIVDEGMQAGEITGHFDHDIRHTMDEILREADKGEDADELLEKIEDLREKVSEALDEGEITSPDRASAIDQALVTLEETLRDAQD